MGISPNRWCSYTTEGRKQGRAQKKRLMIQLGFIYKGCYLFCIGQNSYKFTKESKSFIEIRRAEDNGIDLFKIKDRKMKKAMHSKTPFDNIQNDAVLITKIIDASLE